MSALGVVTIGQAPRQDIARSFAAHFDRCGVEIVQAGALDGLSEDYIRSELAPGVDEAAYVTKLLSGNSVELAKHRIVSRLQEHIDELETRCEAIVVVCTGDFPTLRSTVDLFFPDQLLVRAARERGVKDRLGLVVPLARQRQDIARKWEVLQISIHTTVATPYGDSDLTAAAAELAVHRPELVVLDCMGYTSAHGAAARRSSACEVIVPQDFIPEYVAQHFAAKGSAT